MIQRAGVGMLVEMHTVKSDTTWMAPACWWKCDTVLFVVLVCFFVFLTGDTIMNSVVIIMNSCETSETYSKTNSV